MVSRIVVREAVPDDAEEVAKLIARLKALNEELDPHYKVVDNIDEVSMEYVREMMESGKARVLVAVDSAVGSIVGVLIYRIVDRRFYVPRVKAQIVDFYVLPKYRGRRIGTLLLEKAAEMAKGDGAGMITVIYPALNTIAGRFYEAKSFIDLAHEKYKRIY